MEIRLSFDDLAPHYDWMERLSAGNLLQRVRTAWLEALEGRQHLLSVGEGHGRFASACAARFPEAALTCLEPSAGMRARAQRRLGDCPVQWVTESVLDWKPERTYDAIVTCFFLDCFPQPALDAVVAHLASAAAPDAVWLLADFAIPERPWVARFRARVAHEIMYGFFRATTGLQAGSLAAPDEALRKAGFERVGRQDFDWGLLHSDCWQRLRG